MGGTTFQEHAKGRNVQEAFENAVAEAVHEYGHGSYSGTIKEKPGVTLLTKPKGKQLDKFIDEMMDENEKWGDAFAVEIGSEKVKRNRKVLNGTQVKDNPVQGTRKWQTYHVCYMTTKQKGEYGLMVNTPLKELKKFEKKTDALKWARNHIEKSKDPNMKIEIKIEKHIVNGSNLTATVLPKQKEETYTEEIKEYVLFGWASC